MEGRIFNKGTRVREEEGKRSRMMEGGKEKK
jgi:hypothetical protein